MDYIIYARVSTKLQDKLSDSIEHQEYMCKDFALKQGWDIQGTYQDVGISGAILKRPGLVGLFEMLKKRKGPCIVLATTQDRFIRNIGKYNSFKEKVQSLGGILATVDGTIVPSTSGEFTSSDERRELNTQVAAHLFIRENREKVKRGMRAAGRSGLRVSNPPVGYCSSSLSKVFSIDKKNYAIVETALRGFASGRFLTKRQVLDYLKESKLLKEDGVSEYVYDYKLVDRILNNAPYYAGYIELPDDEEMVEGLHQPIIRKAVMRKVQFRLAERKAKNSRTSYKKVEKLDFKNHISCVVCNARMYSGVTTSKGRQYPYYWCSNKLCSEHKKNISQQKVEKEFLSSLTRVWQNTVSMKDVKELFDIGWKEHCQLMQSETHRIAMQKRSLEKSKKQLVCQMGDCTSQVARDAVEEMLVSTIEQIKKADKEIKSSANKNVAHLAWAELCNVLSQPQESWKGFFADYRANFLSLLLDGNMFSYDRSKDKVVFDKLSDLFLEMEEGK